MAYNTEILQVAQFPSNWNGFEDSTCVFGESSSQKSSDRKLWSAILRWLSFIRKHGLGNDKKSIRMNHNDKVGLLAEDESSHHDEWW